MLSSFASFLPSALHLNTNSDLPRPTVKAEEAAQTEDEDDGDRRSLPPERAQYAEQPSKGKDRDGKNIIESFVFVRPPPSKSNHPLNLQVQLVPPNAKPPTGVVDGPTTPTSATSNASSGSDGTSLHRTSSNRSDTSTFNNSSTTSFSSIASSTTSSSSRRAIIPLYNLQAHNVMTNVIVDAGTDAKIAKFQKRGIELIDVAMLEPVEVWGERDGRGERDARRESMRLSVDEMGAMVTNISSGAGGSVKSGPATRSLTGVLQSGSRPVTPSAGSSAVSLHSQPPSMVASGSPNPSYLGKRESPPNSQRPSTPSDSMASLKSDTNRSLSPVSAPSSPPLPQVKRNIFGKLFKRNSGILSTGSNSTTASSSASATPVGTPQKPSPSSTMPSFSSFALHPAPTTHFMRDTPSSSSLKQSRSPVLSSSSQQTTPTASQIPRQPEEPLSPTTTVIPTKERGHGRNISLTGITTPIKATLKTNKNRFSGMISGVGVPLSSSPGSGLGISEDANRSLRPNSTENKRDVSPSPSVARSNRSRLSWVGSTNATVESHSTASSGAGTTPIGPSAMKEFSNGNGQGYPLMLTQTQMSAQAESAGMNPSALRQQQLQLRPPVLGIQPSYVSSAPSTSQSAIPGNLTSPLVAALSPRVSEKDQENVLAGQRALMYVWLVRRWLKKRPSTILNFAPPSEIAASVGGFFAGKKKEASSHSSHVHAQEPSTGMIAGSGNGPPHLPYGGYEVRFEWKRAKAKEVKKGSGKKKDTRGRNRSASGIASIGGAESDGEVEKASIRDRSVDAKERLKKEAKKKNRASTGSFGTNASKEYGFESTGSRQFSRDPTMMGEDDGEESDPEDSETPWVCTLKVRRSVAAAVASSTSGLLSPPPMTPPPTAGLTNFDNGIVPLEPQVLRVKVGTLSPTPHHPKVVAMLKVPFPLPHVEVERMTLVRRDGRKPAEDRLPKEPYTGLLLTGEEIKDIVCSTGLWLVVREGFGGVGKVSRKGDGWRIRA
ncbi:hypothetical protein CPB83DRAFT_853662 [Crepidotus variabilis]|uniref:Uncharacterized protein n=1 Tax=Crepidotus variabilis TaxID=179855 RepID=A0A9P6EGT6_9AGAR|nr:hypothetical protein CPB83DRAFT_853662 [Crepidotus variabilis]